MNYSKKQLQPLITKYNIDVEHDENFRTIIELFDNQTPYQIWAIKLLYEKTASMPLIIAVKKFSLKYQTMISRLQLHNIVSYNDSEKFSQLIHEMAGVKVLVDVKSIIEKFNTSQRTMLREHIFGSATAECTPLQASSDEFRNKCDFLLKFGELPLTTQHNAIKVLSAVSDVRNLVDSIQDSLQNTYKWCKSDLMRFIREDKRCRDVTVVYDKDDIVILEIPTFEAGKALAFTRTQWCLTREESTFRNYANCSSTSKQYFYFDFSKNEISNVAHIGLTIDGEQILYAHDTNNESIVDKKINATVLGKSGMMNIKDILAAANIKMNVFIKLRGLKNFTWNLTDIRKYIKNSANLEEIYCENNRVIVRIKNHDGFVRLMGHTLIKAEPYFRDTNNVVYGIIDTNVESDDDLCMVALICSKDMFGLLSFNSGVDAYNHSINPSQYLANVKIGVDKILNLKGIQPELLLHKYLCEKDEHSAIELIRNNPKLNVNHCFNDMAPIFVASNNGMWRVITEMFNHPKFNFGIKNAIDEPLLQTLIYDYRRMCVYNGQYIKEFETIIKSLIDNKNYDCNTVNGNLDSPIMVAAESSYTTWIVSYLLDKRDIKLSLVNDVNRTAIGNAMYFGNTEAFNILKNKGIALTDYDKTISNEKGYVI